MVWEPERYEQFRDERYRPFDDLVGLINVRRGLQVIDLGCGTGELTARLADLLSDSDVLGIDASLEMLTKAVDRARPGLQFETRRIEDVRGEWDLVFSHAAMQWLEHHEKVIPRLLSLVKPGGQVAIQMPSNFSHPTHVIYDQLAHEEPFWTGLNRWERTWPVLTIEEYAELLYDNDMKDVTVFEKLYPHVLADADAMADWMMGTALTMYRERMTPELYDKFIERYRELLRREFPSRPVFFGFRRILFAATRPA